MPPIDEWITFIHTAVFDSEWTELGLSDEDLARLQQALVDSPEAGVVIRGTGGLRKLRFAPPYTGKSGGYRICYSYFPERETVLLVFVYGKRTTSTLEPAEKKAIARLLKEFQQEISRGKEHDDSH